MRAGPFVSFFECLDSIFFWFYLSSTLREWRCCACAQPRAAWMRSAASDSALFLCFIPLVVRCVVGVGAGPRMPYTVPPRSILACTMLLERVFAVWAVSPLIRSPAQVSFRSGSSAHASLGGGHPFRSISTGSGTCGRRGWVPWGRTGQVFWDAGLPSVLLWAAMPMKTTCIVDHPLAALSRFVVQGTMGRHRSLSSYTPATMTSRRAPHSFAISPASQFRRRPTAKGTLSPRTVFTPVGMLRSTLSPGTCNPGGITNLNEGADADQRKPLSDVQMAG